PAPLSLLMFGLYLPCIAVLSESSLTIFVVFIAGAICGLTAFFRVLSWLLDNRSGGTLAVMSGFMLSSLRALWPWGEKQDAGSLAIIVMFILGAAIVGGFIYADTRIAKQKTAEMQAAH